VPSYSSGFWVAITVKLSDNGWLVPSMVTCFSCIASNMADWVLAGARLISSASRISVKTGPGRKLKVAVLGSKTLTPVTSAGIRSGVSWIRENLCPNS